MSERKGLPAVGRSSVAKRDRDNTPFGSGPDLDQESFLYAESGRTPIELQAPVKEAIKPARGIVLQVIFSLPFILLLAIVLIRACGGTH